MHGSIELLALITIGVQLALKLRWTGWATLLKHKRTTLKVRDESSSVRATTPPGTQ